MTKRLPGPGYLVTNKEGFRRSSDRGGSEWWAVIVPEGSIGRISGMVVDDREAPYHAHLLVRWGHAIHLNSTGEVKMAAYECAMAHEAVVLKHE